MYIKIIGSIVLILSAAAVGYLKAEELEVRVRVLKEMKRMITFLQGELRFHRAELSEAFESVSERVDPLFGAFLRQTAEELEKKGSDCFENIWEKQYENLLQAECFRKEDAKLFEMLEGSLGYLDLTMQTESLNLAAMQVEEVIKTAEEQHQTRGKLYRTMGVSIGALVTLLII